MNIRKGFIVGVIILVVTQLSVSRALDVTVHNGNSVLKIRRPRSNPPPGFTVPSPTNQLRILESKVSDLEEAIKEMRNSSSVDSYKTRLDFLESATEFIRKSVDNLTSQNNRGVPNLQYTIDDLTTAVDNARSELEGPNSMLRYEIVRDIKGRDFDSASRKLGNLTTALERSINLIVQYVYDNEEANFDKILRFGNSNHLNGTLSLIVFQALNYEMENNKNNDYLNILKLIKSLENKVINQNVIITRDLRAATKLKQTLHEKVKDIIVTDLIREMHTENFRAVSKISEDIFVNYPVLYEEVISEAIKEVYERADKKKLVNFFTHHTHHEQSIFGFSAVFNELKVNNHLNRPILITLAMGLKKALDAYTYVSDSSYNKGLALEESLPESVKSLVFSKQVCLKNKRFNEYLYAYKEGARKKKDRSVFTWLPGKRIYEGVWSIEPTADTEKFLIKNDRNNEYLYAYLYRESDENFWTTVGTSAKLNDQFYWTFEPKGDDMYIKNTRFYGEYLFIDTGRPVKNIDIGKLKNNSSLWTIENCSFYDYHHSVKPFQNASVMFQNVE